MNIDIKVLWDYYCEWKISHFPLVKKDFNLIFHNKIPRRNYEGKPQFNDKNEFIEMIKKFKSDIEKNKDSLCHWLGRFNFKKIYIIRHINSILRVHENICKEFHKENKNKIIEYWKIKQLLIIKDDDCSFLLECRFLDWNKISRMYFVVSFNSKDNIERCILYPLFVDANHICCNTKDWDKIVKFLKDESNFLGQ